MHSRLDLTIRPLDPATDEPWATAFLESELSGRLQARRGELVDVLDGEALVAFVADRPVGLLTFRPDGDDRVELAALAVSEPGRGVGSALIAALVDTIRRRGGARIRVVTTNDNLDALRLYQRRGFRLVELRAGAIDDARRRLKPAIPELAANGIPLRDELELELEV